MKRVYETPIAREELFVANTYIAGCSLNISSTSTQNKMKCIIPWHNHKNNEYFASVWLDATASNCSIKVTRTTTKTSVLNGNNFHPAENAIVYGADGTAYKCTEEYSASSSNKPGQSGQAYYLPWSKGDTDTVCVGSYVNEGSYDEIYSKVFS